MRYKHEQRQIWFFWAYLGLLFGPERGPFGPLWAQMCGMVHSNTNKEGKHDIDILWDILG